MRCCKDEGATPAARLLACRSQKQHLCWPAVCAVPRFLPLQPLLGPSTFTNAIKPRVVRRAATPEEVGAGCVRVVGEASLLVGKCQMTCTLARYRQDRTGVVCGLCAWIPAVDRKQDGGRCVWGRLYGTPIHAYWFLEVGKLGRQGSCGVNPALRSWRLRCRRRMSGQCCWMRLLPLRNEWGIATCVCANHAAADRAGAAVRHARPRRLPGGARVCAAGAGHARQHHGRGGEGWGRCGFRCGQAGLGVSRQRVDRVGCGVKQLWRTFVCVPLSYMQRCTRWGQRRRRAQGSQVPPRGTASPLSYRES